jgi:putative IMPACT (imprinted ancient) family translation regulator
VNLVLENSDLQTYVKLERIQISFDYSSLSIVEYNINQLELKIAGKEFLDNVSFIVEGSEEALAELIKILPRNIKSEKL